MATVGGHQEDEERKGEEKQIENLAMMMIETGVCAYAPECIDVCGSVLSFINFFFVMQSFLEAAALFENIYVQRGRQ